MHPIIESSGLGWAHFLGRALPSPAALIDTAHVFSLLGAYRLSSGATKILLHHNDVHRDVIQGRRLVVLQLGQGGHAMAELEYRLERFETLAAECELIAKLATDGTKRELYLRLALHYRELVTDMRTAIETKDAVVARPDLRVDDFH